MITLLMITWSQLPNDNIVSDHIKPYYFFVNKPKAKSKYNKSKQW